jgi:hypothetical protein
MDIASLFLLTTTNNSIGGFLLESLSIICSKINKCIIQMMLFYNFCIKKFNNFFLFDKRNDISYDMIFLWIEIFKQIIDPKKIIFVILNKSCHYSIYTTTKHLHDISQTISGKRSIKFERIKISV